MDPRRPKVQRHTLGFRTHSHSTGFALEKLEKSLVPKVIIAELNSGVAHVAELADALDSGSSE